MGRVKEAWDFVRYARFVRNAGEYATLVPDYFRSSAAPVCASEFSDVHTFIFFAGIGRSGTTLLGALLDAHPNMVVANQQCVFKYLHPCRFSRQRIFRLLQLNSAQAACDNWRGGGDYCYAVPGQWQGRSERIEVIGDKSKSAQSLEWLYSRPGLLRKLAQTVRVRVRILYMIRNPYDTIARRSLRRGVPLERITREYFAHTDRLTALLECLNCKSDLDQELIPVRLEDFIADPITQLAGICQKLGVQPTNDYLAACAGIVHSKPSEPRKRVNWPVPLLEDIERRIQKLPYLKAYVFADAAEVRSAVPGAGKSCL